MNWSKNNKRAGADFCKDVITQLQCSSVQQSGLRQPTFTDDDGRGKSTSIEPKVASRSANNSNVVKQRDDLCSEQVQSVHFRRRNRDSKLSNADPVRRTPIANGAGGTDKGSTRIDKRRFG